MTVNKIDVSVMACDEYILSGLGFSNVIASGIPLHILSYCFLLLLQILHLSGTVDFSFILSEADSFLDLEVDPTFILKLIQLIRILRGTSLLSRSDFIEQRGDDKLPVIIAKDLKDEKADLLKVLKFPQASIRWKTPI
ncbi:hypothetical protein Tco_1069457 [Tanacetum coccineum]|uniref:Uncharacterized protein n=1 Tax=Tanacetum coccineum TaxID=301880 RepID=A0ABQ5HII6_9ASTR